MNEWARNYEFLEDGWHGHLFAAVPKRVLTATVLGRLRELNAQFAKICNIAIPPPQPPPDDGPYMRGWLCSGEMTVPVSTADRLREWFNWHRLLLRRLFTRQIDLVRQWCRERTKADAARLRHRWKKHMMAHRPYKPP